MKTENEYRDIWQQAVDQLPFAYPQIKKASVESWLSQVVIDYAAGGRIYLSTPEDPDGFTKDRIKMTFQDKLEALCGKLAGEKITILFSVENPPPPQKTRGDQYTFDNFVVGDSNKLAHAACLVVADQPGTKFNPLFIYGGVGLGKTHLMKAIGNRVLENHPDYRVCYVSCEEFTNDLIKAIADNKTPAFRDKYRTCNLLLIDDIQFLAGKESTQDEMFHTFNSLYDAGSQIVLSSDRKPEEIPTLEDRLRTRFQWGMITDIKPPDLETRVAILMKKAQAENLTIPMNVLQYIAEAVPSNIRELEGILVRLSGYASLYGTDLSYDNAMRYLADILPGGMGPKKAVTVEDIQAAVCRFYRISLEDMLSKKRMQTIAYPRQIAMFLARQLTDVSFTVLGDIFGGKDHTTVMHSVEKIENEVKKDDQLKSDLTKLCGELSPDKKLTF